MFAVSVLPNELLTALRRVGIKLERQQRIEAEYRGIVNGLNTLPAILLTRAESEIVEAARLYRWRRQLPILIRLFGRRLTDRAQLRHLPGLEFLFLFHRDGHIREAALVRISGPIPSAFLFAALAWRLNDWVEQVRSAALDCATRVFPITSADIVADAAMALLGRYHSWGRWGPRHQVLEEAFARTDVAEKLANILAGELVGPSATILQYALRSAVMDAHLARLARDAIQPAVRAMATRALIDGVVRWPNGWRWRWIDKSMGIRRSETVFETRALTTPSNRFRHIEVGLIDRSAMVRNAAISGLIRYRDEIPNARTLAASLLTDRSRRVRERAEFLQK